MMEEKKIQEDFARKLEKDLSRLEPESLSPAKETITQNRAFEGLCFEDYRSRLKSRKNYGRLIVALLIAQNVAFYSLIGVLAARNITALQHLQWLFSYSMKLIINLLFILTAIIAVMILNRILLSTL